MAAKWPGMVLHVSDPILGADPWRVLQEPGPFCPHRQDNGDFPGQGLAQLGGRAMAPMVRDRKQCLEPFLSNKMEASAELATAEAFQAEN